MVSPYLGKRVFASVDQKTGEWFSRDDGGHWPVMLAEGVTT